MKRKPWNKPALWVTMKTAKAIIKQEFGVSGAGLRVLESGNGVYIYELLMGRFVIVIENDWSERNGLIRMKLGFDTNGFLSKYFDPETLAEDYEAAAANRATIRAEWCSECELKQEERK